jgi:membrane protease subunit HflK
MQQIYANTSKVIVDTKGQGSLIYLPLDKLTQAGAAAAGAANAPAGSAAPAPDGNSNREMQERAAAAGALTREWRDRP